MSLFLRPPEQFIPPVQEPYQYIIFRASEVKDLAVDEPTPRQNIHDDPAVLGVSAQASIPHTPAAMKILTDVNEPCAQVTESA